MENGSGVPKVSVVIPVYNAEKFIDRCLGTVCGQTLTDIEVIVVNDGSTDKTLEKLHLWANDDARIIVVEQENRYAGAARNKGLSIATGEYLSFLDADDFFDLDMLDLMYSKAKSADADVVVCKSSHFDNATREIRPIDFSLRYVDMDRSYSGSELGNVLFRFCVGWPWDKMFRRSFVKQHELQFQDQRTTNDAYFVFMALAQADCIAFVDRHLAFHRTNNSESLEYTRCRSWENACNAIAEIEIGLRNAGLYDRFERSFINWALNFSMWNYHSLDGEAQDGLLHWIETELEKKLPYRLEDYFFQEDDKRSAVLLREDRHGLLKRCLDNVLIDHGIDSLKKENEKLQKMIKFEIDWRDAELAEKRMRVESLQREVDAIHASRAYRLAKRLSRMFRMFKRH